MPTQADSEELKAFQADLKRKMRYLGSFFSLALIVFGLYLLIGGLLAVVNGNKTSAPNTEDLVYQATGLKAPETSEVPACPAPSENASPSIGDSGINTVRASGIKGAAKAQNMSRKIEQSGSWQATDYIKGDLAPGNYTVELGDTLWEIAEAVYGSGFKWTEILKANNKDIKKLPNGQQALIVPGQVLIIPLI